MLNLCILDESPVYALGLKTFFSNSFEPGKFSDALIFRVSELENITFTLKNIDYVLIHVDENISSSVLKSLITRSKKMCNAKKYIIYSLFYNSIFDKYVNQRGANAYFLLNDEKEYLITLFRKLETSERIKFHDLRSHSGPTFHVSFMRNDSNTYYFSDKEKYIIDLLVAGTPLDSIANTLNISRNSCQDILEKISYKFRFSA